MEQPRYSVLAEIYAYLMRKIDYKDWAEYLFALFRNFASSDERILELGGGVGAIAGHLNEYFPSIILTDYSREMLAKAGDEGIYKVCCDMRHFPFKNKFDIIYSTFDSVNYLLTEADLMKLFTEVCAVSDEDTVFTFDASLEKNSRRYEKHLNRKGSVKGISFVQKSRYDREEMIHYNEFEITVPGGEIFTETHIQKIHKFETYFDLIDEAGLYVADCFDAFSFEKATPKSLRAQFVLKKKR